MKTKLLIILLLLSGCFLNGFSQETIAYKGIVKDGKTGNPIPSVSLFIDRDTICIQSDGKGRFEITANNNSIIHFRKKGYLWKDVRLADTNISDVIMFPSSPNSHPEVDEIEINGKLLAKEIWDDINPEYFIELSVTKINDVTRLIIRTQ